MFSLQNNHFVWANLSKWYSAMVLATVTFLSVQPVQADQLPDFQALVNEHGNAVVKITVAGRATSEARQNTFPDLPPQFRYFFENNPSQPQPTSGFGSGFIISDDGYIVTNAHVVANARDVRVQLHNRTEYIANVIGSDERSDIALLKIDADNLPTVVIGDSDDVTVGQWVLAIGSPFGFEYTATQGIVSALSRSLPDENYVPFIQTDAAVNPGNSGGPLFDTDGRVIGVNAQIYSRSGGYMGLSFAIPINVAMSVVEQLKNNGYVSRGWLGVYIQNVDQALAESFGLQSPKGALVSRVTEGSPAAKAGVALGDIILSFDGKEISRSSDLPPLVGLVPVGEKVDITLQRNNKEMVIPITIAELEDGSIKNVQKTQGKLKQQLGLVVGPSMSQPGTQFRDVGLTVQEIVPGSTAELAGIRRGDTLVAFNRIELESEEQLSNLIDKAPKNRPLPLLILRNNSPLYAAITLP